MDNRPSIDEIVRAIQMSYDNHFGIGEERKAILQSIMVNLKNHGYTKDDLNDRTRTRIAKVCLPPKDAYKGTTAKYVKWLAASREAVNDAVDSVYGFSFQIKVATEEDILVKTLDRPKVEESKEEPEYVRYGKKLDRSIFANVPQPEVLYDDEASKLLGFDDE